MPTRNKMVPAANRNPKKRSSTLIAKIPSAELLTLQDQQVRPRRAPSVPSTRRGYGIPSGHARTGDDGRIVRQRPALAQSALQALVVSPKIAGFYVQTEAFRSS